MTLLVGPQSCPFTLHTTLLITKSTVFASMLHRYISTSEQAIPFPDDDPAAFEALVYWLYIGNIGAIQTHSLCDGERFRISQLLIRLWVLADKLAVAALTNEAMRKLVCVVRQQYLAVEHVLEIYKTTVPGSMLRKLATEDVVWSYLDGQTQNDKSEGSGIETSDLRECFYRLDFVGDFCEKMRDYARTFKWGDPVTRAKNVDEVFRAEPFLVKESPRADPTKAMVVRGKALRLKDGQWSRSENTSESANGDGDASSPDNER